MTKNNLTILIDPGHGGTDPGAVAGGVREADINLQVARLLAAALTDQGVSVRFTREGDRAVPLRNRALIEHTLRPDLFVSLHCNGAASEAPRGIEVFTSPGQTAADAAAEQVLQSIRQAFPERTYRVDMSDGDQDREARFYVLTSTRCPALLLEMGFLTNPEERAWLNSPQTQTHMALAVAAGVLAWKGAA